MTTMTVCANVAKRQQWLEDRREVADDVVVVVVVDNIVCYRWLQQQPMPTDQSIRLRQHHHHHRCRRWSAKVDWKCSWSILLVVVAGVFDADAVTVVIGS